MKRKIKILCVAPYLAMKSAIKRIAENFNSIDIHIEIGDIEEGAAIVKYYNNSGFDAIISRGGTKLEIEKVTDLPVFDIPISYFDLINVINLIESYEAKTAIIAYKNIANNARILCDILHKDYTIKVIDSWTDAEEKIINLKKQGYSLIIGDTVAITYAEKLGMQSMLLVSGDESIQSTFEQVINTVTHFLDLSQNINYINSYFANQNTKFLCMNSKLEILFSNDENIKKNIIKYCSDSVPIISKNKPIYIQKKISSNLYTIRGNTSELNGENLYFFTIELTNCKYCHLPGWSNIDIYSVNELRNKTKMIPRFCENFISDFKERCCLISKTNYPKLIIGQPGTEKEVYASQLHFCTKNYDSPLYMIYCKEMSLRFIEKLLNKETSPLYSLDKTICIKDADLLPEDAFITLIDGLKDLPSNQLKDIIFICTESLSTNRNSIQRERINYIKKHTKSAELHIDPIISKQQDISNYAILYIHNQNSLHNKQFLGIEPEAINLISEYAWPENLTQLQRVLDEAMLISPSPRITARVIQKIIDSEKYLLVKQDEPIMFQTTGTLAEIEKKIVQYILEEENMNHLKTAKRLGISRTTLWRMLNNK